MLDFAVLAQQCAPIVHATTMEAVVRTESGFNPYAIGVVGGHLERQPHDLTEAIATAHTLAALRVNFSVGLTQVNSVNLARYGLTYETAFDPCANLRAGSEILHDCYDRAVVAKGQGALALRAAISCYYSGNFTRGLVEDYRGTSYVQRVVAGARSLTDSTGVVPAIRLVTRRMPDAQVGDGPGTIRIPDIKKTLSPGSNRSESHPAWDAFGDYQCDEGTCK